MLVLYNAKVYAHPSASALAIRGGRIAAVGTDADIRSFANADAEVIDLHGALILPGLVDAHFHFEWFSLGLRFVGVETASLDEALARIAARAAVTPKGEWIRGHGWNNNTWGTGFPLAAQLDAVAPDHPVYLTAKSMHMGWANSLALRFAQIDRTTIDPHGGSITRDPAGDPTGTLAETAMDLMTPRSYTARENPRCPVPEISPESLADAYAEAQPLLWQAGLTGVHDFDGVRSFRAWQILRERGKLGLRVVKNIPVAYLDDLIASGLRSGFGDPWLRFGNVKIFADGALGPRTASMIGPYADEPANRGIVVTSREEMSERGLIAMKHGLALTVHAIGDQANRDLAGVYETLRAAEGVPRLRHRAEHMQIVDPADAPTFARLGIIGSVQPIHATSDMFAVDKFCGARGAGAYSWRRHLSLGTRLAFGSDTPVEPYDPFQGIHAAVTRRRADGSPAEEGWYPDQRLTVAESVDAYTQGAAYAGYNEQDLGSIAVGKLADLTLVDRDLFACPAMDLRNARAIATIVNGEFKFRTV